MLLFPVLPACARPVPGADSGPVPAGPASGPLSLSYQVPPGRLQQQVLMAGGVRKPGAHAPQTLEERLQLCPSPVPPAHPAAPELGAVAQRKPPLAPGCWLPRLGRQHLLGSQGLGGSAEPRADAGGYLLHSLQEALGGPALLEGKKTLEENTRCPPHPDSASCIAGGRGGAGSGEHLLLSTAQSCRILSFGQILLCPTTIYYLKSVRLGTGR